MHAASLHAHAGSHGVDALVVTLHGHLGSLARHAGYALDGDEAVVDFGHLSLEQPLQEHGAGAREDNLGVVVLVVHPQDDGTDGLALAVLVGRYLLRFGQDELVALVVDDEHLAFPHLIHFAAHHLSHTVFVLVVERVVFQFQNLGGQGLPKGKDGSASELLEVDHFAYFLAHLVVVFYLLGVGQAYLLVLVGHLAVFHDGAVAVDFQVALVGVHDDVEVLITAEYLGNHAAEALFEHAHERGAVNVLGFLELFERFDHIRNQIGFLCCHSFT